ncbi:glutamate-5-semialdehyde dehydrogenase [Barrientosiimonas humi]|uniref:Gamma-glutamyl phosphate reductase n=1 Tax=Barrientosiimonas humi TaxID=999931 RepID=A0A542XCS5_9MICO|nr:glutamate-5-semialdehyde dehydrogenase [Barrientosiimonas humi]TQL33621.1 glutamate-5-semialdehyde dehydrogenase [Barrientosiimonas humi]CAG7573608.1 Gamma-glutamyl phosphate reductase [Barrientosiimonas humi]
MSEESVERVRVAAEAARVASRRLALLPRAEKDAALLAMADAVEQASERVVAANADDVRRGEEAGTRANLLDRLRLTPERVSAVAQALRDLAALPDPIGEVVRGSTLANGLQITQVRVPMGVVGMIYEARPNVTVDAAGLGLKSGNAMILRGGSAAASTNAALVDVLRGTLAERGLPADAVQLLEGGRDDVRALVTARGLVDLVIPRGGADLIQTVVTTATVPVIETGIGNVHVYVDAAADLDMARAIAVNSKTHRPSVCNAAESLLVHEAVAEEFLPKVLAELGGAGVLVHGDERTATFAEQAGAAYDAVTDEDWAAEHLALEMSVGVVPSLDAAIEHITTYGSQHTESIVTEDRSAARRFVAEIDAAVVMVNASTRFTDGGEFGFGAEIGISTQKLHARGPMALQELTSTKWIVQGDGQVRA